MSKVKLRLKSFLNSNLSISSISIYSSNRSFNHQNCIGEHITLLAVRPKTNIVLSVIKDFVYIIALPLKTPQN